MSRIGLKFSQMILHTSTSKMMNNLPFLLVVLHKPTLWPSTFNYLSAHMILDPRSQIYNNTRLQCAHCSCSLGMWLTRPFHDNNWRQSVFIYARSYQSIKAWKHLYQLHYSRLKRIMSACAWTGLDKLSRSACVIIAGMCSAFADPCTCICSYLHKGKGLVW